MYIIVTNIITLLFKSFSGSKCIHNNLFDVFFLKYYDVINFIPYNLLENVPLIVNQILHQNGMRKVNVF